MSHLTDVRLTVRSLDDLERGGAVLGFDLIRDKREHAWYGMMVGDSAEGRQVAAERGIENLGKCDHVLRPKNWRQGDYEIGVVANGDGTFNLLYDSWGPGQKITQLAGPNLARLRQEYAVAVTESRHASTLARDGFSLEREDLANGRVRLRMRRR